MVTDQIGGQFRKSAGVIVAPAIFERYVATLDETRLGQATAKRRQRACGSRVALDLGELADDLPLAAVEVVSRREPLRLIKFPSGLHNRGNVATRDRAT